MTGTPLAGRTARDPFGYGAEPEPATRYRANTENRVILTYGIFDQLHPENMRGLQTLRAMGRELIVGCATDEFIAERGFGPAKLSFDKRRALLTACRFVDRVIEQNSLDQKHTDIINYNVSVIAMGSEWAGQLDHLTEIAQVIYLERLTDLARPATARPLMAAAI